MDVFKNIGEKLGAGWCGLLIVGLSIAVLVLLIVCVTKEGFTSNTVLQQDSDQDFYEGYISMGAPRQVPKRNVEGQTDKPGSSYFRQVTGAGAPTLGSVTLQGCTVSPMLNADPWQWQYNVIQDGAPAATVSASGGSPAAPQEGMKALNDAHLGLAMAGGSARRGIL
jgi:hypothetical protein